ncbi:MAG: hypothetical protein K2X81_05800, partial [Candidatus Obscuribacterales bacterium]|nr:hypothetical protein [Candidatus Obscuribacterales bacterium]
PVDLSIAKLASGKAIPAGTRAYKIGKQATQVDDKIIFMDKLPDFSGKASDSFQVVMGKLKQAVKLYGNCRLEFVNVESAAGRPAFVRCEAWDENYRQSHAEPTK